MNSETNRALHRAVLALLSVYPNHLYQTTHPTCVSFLLYQLDAGRRRGRARWFKRVKAKGNGGAGAKEEGFGSPHHVVGMKREVCRGLRLWSGKDTAGRHCV